MQVLELKKCSMAALQNLMFMQTQKLQKEATMRKMSSFPTKTTLKHQQFVFLPAGPTCEVDLSPSDLLQQVTPEPHN